MTGLSALTLFEAYKRADDVGQRNAAMEELREDVIEAVALYVTLSTDAHQIWLRWHKSHMGYDDVLRAQDECRGALASITAAYLRYKNTMIAAIAQYVDADDTSEIGAAK